MLRTLVWISLTLPSCASVTANTGGAPAWTAHLGRSADGERTVFVARAEAVDAEGARFKAEGAALEDIANECSLIPRRTQMESRYSVRGTYEYTVYAKLSVPTQDCADARLATEPNSIRYFANEAFTQHLKRYQDLVETGEMPKSLAPVRVIPGDEPPPLPERDMHWDESLYFYVLRQAIAYQKQIVVLSPEPNFSPFSDQAELFAAALQPAVQEVQSMWANNPALRERPQTWSQLAYRPRVPRPQVLANANETGTTAVSKPERKPIRKRGGPVRPPPQSFPKREGR